MRDIRSNACDAVGADSVEVGLNQGPGHDPRVLTRHADPTKTSVTKRDRSWTSRATLFTNPSVLAHRFDAPEGATLHLHNLSDRAPRDNGDTRTADQARGRSTCWPTSGTTHLPRDSRTSRSGRGDAAGSGWTAPCRCDRGGGGSLPVTVLRSRRGRRDRRPGTRRGLGSGGGGDGCGLRGTRRRDRGPRPAHGRGSRGEHGQTLCSVWHLDACPSRGGCNPAVQECLLAASQAGPPWQLRSPSRVVCSSARRLVVRVPARLCSSSGSAVRS